MDLDSGIRPNQQTAIIDTQGKMTDKQRIKLLIALIEKRRRERILGPGRYEIVREKKQKEYKFGVVYRRMSVDIRRRNKQSNPGPQSYEVNDVLIRENPRNIKFTRSERYKQEKQITLEALDLNISINFISKNPTRLVNSKSHRIKGGKFLKEKESQAILTDNQIINEHAEVQRGPSTYSPKFQIVEKRNDIGIIKEKQFGEIESKRFREKIMEKYMVNEEVGDPGGEVVSLKLVKKEHNAAYAYKEPTDQRPEHIPEKLLFPEKWQFYEKDSGQLPELAGKLFKSKEDFHKNEEELSELKWLLNKFRKQPAIGTYDPEEIPSHIPQINFTKMIPRDTIEEEPGEELLLSPEKPAKHIMGRRFSGMLGRDEHIDEKEELVIDKDYQQIDGKVKGMVEMQKQLSRKEDDSPQEEVLNISAHHALVEQKPKGVVEFKRMTGRDFEIKEGDEMVDIDIGPAIDKLKHNPVPAVHMDRGGERFPEKPSEQISGETTEQRIDYEKINNAVKPRVTGMQEFHKGKVKEVKEFRIKEQRKKESKVQSIREERSEADGESFAKFQEDKELQRVKQKEEQEQQDKKKNSKIQIKNQKKKGGKAIEKNKAVNNNSSVGPWNNPSNIQNTQQ